MFLMEVNAGESRENEAPTPFGRVLGEIRSRVGSWRNMTRTMRRKTGETVSDPHLANLYEGDRAPTYEFVLRIARGFPDFAEELFETAGFPLPEEFQTTLPDDILEAQRIRAEWISAAVETLARRRNLATADVIYTLLVEDLERTKPPEEPA